MIYLLAGERNMRVKTKPLDSFVPVGHDPVRRIGQTSRQYVYGHAIDVEPNGLKS